jgi:hypothetical protein
MLNGFVDDSGPLGCYAVPLVFFCGEGPRSRCYGRTAALSVIVQPCDED